MELLRDKWRARGIAIEDAHFELNNSDAPLSWHLMPKQQAAIAAAWDGDRKVVEARKKVEEFLAACPPGQEKETEPAISAAAEAVPSA